MSRCFSFSVVVCFWFGLVIGVAGAVQAQPSSWMANRHLQEAASFIRSCMSDRDISQEQQCLERQYRVAGEHARRYYWEEWRRTRYGITGVAAWTHCVWVAQAALRLSVLDVANRGKWSKAVAMFTAKAEELRKASSDVTVPPPPPVVREPSSDDTLPPPPTQGQIREYYRRQQRQQEGRHRPRERVNRSQREPPPRRSPLQRRSVPLADEAPRTRQGIQLLCLRYYRECRVDCSNRRCRTCCLVQYHRCKAKRTYHRSGFRTCGQ